MPRPTKPSQAIAVQSPLLLFVRRQKLAILAAAMGIAVAAGVFADWWSCLPDDAQPRFVGGQSCAQCHQDQSHHWQGSHHDLAMDRATPDKVLGDFNDSEFTYFDVTSRMFRDGDKFMIHTEGPDGKLADFEIKYVFGVDPLQQYMVEFDRDPQMDPQAIARLQVLRVSWDTQRKRWFYMPPPDVKEKLSPDDDLHWTGIAQRWNTMCADCHSTNLQKNYDPKTGHYRTTFSEIDVSCEACHGPASVHVGLANSRSLFWDRKRGYGLAKLKGGNADTQIHMCAPCHARRRAVHPGFQPGANFHDFYGNELLSPLTYHVDGQILDEVYEFGSFIQSKMYHKGIRCTDCHDPHTARLKHEGNKVCTSCHAHSAGKYDGAAHHHHQTGSKGSLCVECHMPESTYMEVDPRRDHSLRVPRPDLSVKLGTPNACTRCHLHSQPGLASNGDVDNTASQTSSVNVPATDTPLSATTPFDARSSRLRDVPPRDVPPRDVPPSEQLPAQLMEYQNLIQAARSNPDIRNLLRDIDQWAAEKVSQWYGNKPRDRHFAEILHKARQQRRNAEEPLRALARDSRYPAIARATAVAELGQLGTSKAREASIELLSDIDPQVRAAAVANLEGLDQSLLLTLVMPALSDPSRLVRTEAARVMADVPWQELRKTHREALQNAQQEFQAGLMVSHDRATAYLPLGNLFERMGDDEKARRAYETAIRVEPRATGPRSNLSALLERQIEQHQQYLQQFIRERDESKAIHELEVTDSLKKRVQQLRSQELELLARDARLAPENAAVQYRYGLSLYLQGHLPEAEQRLLNAIRLEPDTPTFSYMLALLYQKQQRIAEAIPLVKKLVELQPDDLTFRQLLQELVSGGQTP